MKRTAGYLVLLAAAVASAVVLAWARYRSRVLFVELQQLERARDVLETEWGRLQLEQAALAAPGRVERVARERLHMHVPGPDETVIVKP
ncbi:MAG: cell division protein FtsL [Gammaproteobacteria bacterium]|nr:MAG: cell division protein FtsL [Gammaproteobacteria bacterium]